MANKIKVRLYDGPCGDGYIRGRGETPVWGIYCDQLLIAKTPSGESYQECVHDALAPIHVIQHPTPGPAMDWARLHHWQHETV